MLSERGELGLEAVQKRGAEPCGGQSACSAVDARHPQGARMRWIELGSRFADARSQREDTSMKLKFLARQWTACTMGRTQTCLIALCLDPEVIVGGHAVPPW